jgi:hypothetical protein
VVHRDDFRIPAMLGCVGKHFLEGGRTLVMQMAVVRASPGFS